MNNHLKNLWQTNSGTFNVDVFEKSIEFLIWNRSTYLKECQKLVTTLVDLEQFDADYAWLLGDVRPVPHSMARASLAYPIRDEIDGYGETDRLYNTLRSFMLCVRIALSLKFYENNGDANDAKLQATEDSQDVTSGLHHDSAVRDWVDRLARHWRLNILPDDHVALPTASEDLAAVDAVFTALASTNRDTQWEIQRNLWESWDLTRVLIGGPPRPIESGRLVMMRVPGFDRAQRKGYCAYLELEHLPDGLGYIRHPEVLLLPCGSATRHAFETVQKQLTTLRDDDDESIHWERGVIRWRFYRHNAVSKHATGGSIGGAIACGTKLALCGEESDNVAISAAIDEELNLRPVDEDTLESKIVAAIDARVHTVILVYGQHNQWSTHIVDLLSQRNDAAKYWFSTKGCLTANDAADSIAEMSGPRRAIRQAVYNECLPLELPERPILDGMKSVFVKVPLVEEIEEAELPSLPDRYGDGSDGRQKKSEFDYREQILRRWEEEFLRRKRVTYKPREIESVIADKTRFVLIGPPGSGKTTIVQWLAWCSADTLTPMKWNGRDVIPVHVRLQNWNSEMDIAKYLTQKYCDIPNAPTEGHWRKWLGAGDVLLLLDGLDEVDAVWASAAIPKTLSDYKTCPVIVSCRSASREMLTNCISPDKKLDWSVYTPSPFDSQDQKDYIERYPFHNGFDQTELFEQIERISGADLMAANPLLLSIICFVANNLKGRPLPRTRSQLYDKAVRLLIKKTIERARREGKYAGVSARVERNLLERLALALKYREKVHAYHDQQNSDHVVALKFDRDEINDIIVELICYPGQYAGFRIPSTLNIPMLPHAEGTADKLIEEFWHCSRLLLAEKGDASEGFRFLHRTFQEYLAACALKHWAEGTSRFPGLALDTLKASNYKEIFQNIDRKNNPGEEKTYVGPPLNGTEAYIEFLDQTAWLAEWQEVFFFLTGTLEDPIPLLELISDEKELGIHRDDLFRHRLALAARCLTQIDPVLLAPKSSPYAKITD